MQQPEQQARTEIDQLLTASGWRLQDRDVFDRNVALGVAVRAPPILSEIRTIAQARNVLGAHFNANAFNLRPHDGIRFARQVEKRCDAVVCPDHGRPLKDTGSYWRNRGDTHRLHPLKKPG